MQNPFMIDQPDIVEQYGRGYDIGAMQREDQKAQQAEAANAEMMQQFQQDLYDIYQNPEAGAKEYGALQIKYPQMADSIKKTFDSVDGEKQKSAVSELTQVYSAVQNGRTEYAISLLESKAEAARNSGDEATAAKYDAMVQMGKTDPMLLKDSTGMTLYAIKGGDYLTGIAKAPYTSIEAEASAQQKQAEAYVKGVEAENAPLKTGLENEKTLVGIEETQSNISDKQSQISDRKVKNEAEARKMALEEKKLAYETAKAGGIELDKDSRAFINEKANNASFLFSNANRAADLAAKVDKLRNKEGGGTYQTVEEMAANVVGWKDEEAAIRDEVTRVLTPIAMSNYKKFTSGATSDKDIQTALSGYPNKNDPPETLAAFLRGMEKMQTYDANLEKAKVAWTSRVGSLADANKDFEYQGMKIPAGTSYNDFESAYMTSQIDKGAAKNNRALPANISKKKYVIEARQ